MSKECIGQLLLFKFRPNKSEYEFSDISNIVIEHKRNFRIGGPYLLEHLAQYNVHFKKDPNYDSKNDSLLLRTMFAGIQNSKDIPPEIFEGLNVLEICLMEAGIFKRKYVDSEERVIMPPKDIHQTPITVKRNPDLHLTSRMDEEGRLDDKHLYEIISDLLDSTHVKDIYKRYKNDWEKNIQSFQENPAGKKPGERQKRFKRLNPYDTSTLKQRMDYIEKTYPGTLKNFKEVLAEPFIPERIVLREKYETHPVINNSEGSIIQPRMVFGQSEPDYFEKVINPEGFATPGKIFRNNVGRVWHLEKYAQQIYDYFQRKERDLLQSKS